MNRIPMLLFVLIFTSSWSQVLIINELDADTPSIDDLEFIELKSETPNFSTDGYILVFFNRSSSGGDASYFVYDLNGYTTDINGLLVVGNTYVSPFPQALMAQMLSLNGSDVLLML